LGQHQQAAFYFEFEKILAPASVRQRLVTTARQILRRYDAPD